MSCNCGCSKCQNSEETITLTKKELQAFMDDVYNQTGWSDSSYKIVKFLGDNPTDGT